MTTPTFDTIVAPATPAGRSALAIVRIDGPEAVAIVRQLGAGELAARAATRVSLSDRGDPLDEAVGLFFQQPHSFTGNDLVELYLHGSPLIVQRVIRAAVARGARIAEPGEFSERAVLNGKIDLVQAEAIHDLVSSRTALQARLSLDNLSGHLSREAEVIRESLLYVISRLEAALDFAEEGYEFIERGEVTARLEAMSSRLGGMISTYERGHAVASGISAVILGRPNVGKSTLLNRLVGSDRAIVTDIPGTTRDLLRETIELGGIPVTFIDTAGLRSSSDVVESIGIGRAREAAAKAELILYLVEATRGLTPEDAAEVSRLAEPIVVYTKSDLAAAPAGEIGICARSGDSIEELIRLVDRRISERYVPPEGASVVVNERQRAALASCREAIDAASDCFGRRATEEIVLVELYRAANALGILTGAITLDTVLSEIFGKFCIGK